MTSPILVTGGTGLLGRHVVPLLRAAGCPVRVLSRHPGPPMDGVTYVNADLDSGAGVESAVAGAETILHCAGAAKGDDQKARHLVRAAAGARHLVFISVVGAERVPVVSRVDHAMFGYLAAKREAEQVVAGSGLEWTTLRAGQFYEFTLTVVSRLAKLPVVPVAAGVRFQPVDTAEVAARLVELTLGEPQGLVPDIAGPHAYGMGDLVRSYLAAAGRRRIVVPVRAFGGAYRAIRAGANLAPDRAVGRRTWEDFLAATVSRSA